MPNLLKQPLLHFILIGGLLFVAYGQVSAPAVEEADAGISDLIVVDRAALLDYMQYQANTFESSVFNERLDAMSDEERAEIVADYVREEALYREALRMQMEKGDYIIKQRLVQKVEFLLENLAINTINPTDAELSDFYNQRLANYQVDPSYSFTHIFFDGEKEGMDVARTRAEELLSKSAGISFADAGQHGDRYPFLQNYVERTRNFVSNNFSADFVGELDELAPASDHWYGPIASRYGYHLVMLVNRTAATTPPLEEIREQVKDDYRYEALLSSREAAEAEVIAGYQVQVDLEPAQ
ncbi:MAG: peptidylprolyl isomerase [Pseudomonadota bacterium]